MASMKTTIHLQATYMEFHISWGLGMVVRGSHEFSVA